MPLPSDLFETYDVPATLLDPVVASDELLERSDGLVILANLGFVAIQSESGDTMRILGFHADEENRDEIVPAIDADGRGERASSLSANAKGYGVIMGNTPAAIVRPTAYGSDREVGLYATPELTRDEVAAVHHRNPLSPLHLGQGIARHAVMIGRSKLPEKMGGGVDAAVRSVEQRYGDANFASMDPAPTFMLRQLQRRQSFDVTPTWGIWRDSQQRPLRRLGHIARAD